jgi:Ni/Fe-hydrogenase subunit HybB-like protein
LVLLGIPALRSSKVSIAAAAILAMAGVYAFRIELIVAGMVTPLVQLPPGNAKGTYSNGTASFVYAGTYHPTWVEISIVIGALALLAALITFGYRRFRVMTPGARPTPAAEVSR